MFTRSLPSHGSFLTAFLTWRFLVPSKDSFDVRAGSLSSCQKLWVKHLPEVDLPFSRMGVKGVTHPCFRLPTSAIWGIKKHSHSQEPQK